MQYTPHTFAAKVLDHVCVALTREACTGLARSYVAVGLVAWDTCNQLTVGPERVFRSVQFPAEYFGEDDCFAGWIAVQTNITLTRCAPSPQGKAKAPTAEALDKQHASILRDAAVIWNSVRGQLPDPSWERANVAQQFLGNEGGIIAIETRVTYGLDSESWCP